MPVGSGVDSGVSAPLPELPVDHHPHIYGAPDLPFQPLRVQFAVTKDCVLSLAQDGGLDVAKSYSAGGSGEITVKSVVVMKSEDLSALTIMVNGRPVGPVGGSVLIIKHQ